MPDPSENTSPVPEAATVTEDTGEDTEPKPEPTPLEQVKSRIEALSGAIQKVAQEKETKRVDIESRFQQVQKQLKEEWDQTQKSYDLRLNSLQQELLKSQGVYEYLHNLEQQKGDTE